MRPPDCYVCHLMLREVPDDGRDYFTLVHFGVTEQPKMAPSRVLDSLGRTGHPRNAMWFCNEHVLARRGNRIAINATNRAFSVDLFRRRPRSVTHSAACSA